MMNNEKFIQCVEAHPDLWEKKSKYYKDRSVREKHWENIGNQIFYNWRELDEEQRQDKIKYMKSKWRNIRDSFMRCVHQERRGSPSVKRKKYIYEDLLSFILTTSPNKRTPKHKAENLETEDMRTLKDEPEDDPDALLTPKNEAEDEIEIEESDLLELLPKTKGLEERLVFSTPPQFRSEQNRNEEEDADKSFLMSLLPDVRGLNDGQRLDFRFHCLQFFRDLQRRSGVESTSSYSPSP